MAIEMPVHQLSLTANADLSAKQYHAVKIDASGKMVAAGAGENAIGILQEKTPNTQVGAVMVLGVSKAFYGGAVTAGANLTPDAAGKLVTAGGGDAVTAIALESGGAGELHSVELVTRTSTGVQTQSVLSIPVDLSTLVTGDIITNYIPGINGAIVSIAALVTAVTTDVDADADISITIGATPVTGGLVTLSDANVTPLGNVIAGTAITADNAFTNLDTITVSATVTNAFSDGAILLLITLN